MNAKGGVGKSTITMLLAESLSITHELRVLVIDADPQASVSWMMLGEESWTTAVEDGLTLSSILSKKSGRKIDRSVVRGAGDVKGNERIDLLASDVSLARAERSLESARDSEFPRRPAEVLDDAKDHYDIVLIDCSPSITRYSEQWLRGADHIITPMKADFLSWAGTQVLRSMRWEAAQEGIDYANLLGTVINLFNSNRPFEKRWKKKIQEDESLLAFNTLIPNMAPYQKAAVWGGESGQAQPYTQKYPSQNRAQVQEFSTEVLSRLGML